MNESLLKSNILGRDGFVWWIGRVASQTVWKNANTLHAVNKSKQQRVKVRIIGYHPWEETEMPENDLPWAEVMQDPQVGSGQGGIGETMSLQGGETAVGFFLDGEEAQQPVIFGLLNRNQEVMSSITSDSAITPEKSSEFKNLTNESQKKSRVQRDGTFSVKNPNSVVSKENKVGQAEAGFEKLNTKTTVVPSTCGDDAISQISQALTDFIALTNGLSEVGGKFIDPILEEIVDIPKKVRGLARQIQGVIKEILNNVRKGVIGKMNLIFGKFLAAIKKFNPLAFLTDAAAKLGFTKIVETIFCIFEKVLGGMLPFLQNLLNKIVGQVIGGPICAIEQFVSGILSKAFNLLEKLLGPVMSGLNWLMGGLGAVSSVLKKASSFAAAIYSFISCDAPKCTKPSQWVSNINKGIETAADNWGKQVDNINIFTGISSSLTKKGKQINDSIKAGFGTATNAENQPEEFEYEGTSTAEILNNVDDITGGDLSGNVEDKLGSIEAAISTMPILGGKNSIFNACNPNNIGGQDDIKTTPGTKAANCIPPEIKISGNGSGADLLLVVGNDSRIFSVDVIAKGSGYDNDTSIAVVDNSGYGSGAQVIPQIVDGGIDSVIVLNRGYGYCGKNTGIGGVGVGTTVGIGIGITGSGEGDQTEIGIGIGITGSGPEGGETGIGTDIYGFVEDIFITRPGRSYDEDDKVKICSVGVCTYVRIETTPWGGIGNVIWNPWDREMEEPPTITVESDTGFGAEFVPRMRYSVQSTSDVVRPLIGIATVIDCPTTDHQ